MCKVFPVSVWDTIGAFKWATPAKNIDGSFPEPWRCVDQDNARVWLEGVLTGSEINPKGLYVDFNDKVRGKEALYIGDREARSAFAKQARLEEVLKAITAAGVPCKGLIRGGLLTGILILDDLKHYPFKG